MRTPTLFTDLRDPRSIASLRRRAGRKAGFTLVELIAVIVIIALISLLVVPAIGSLQSAGGFNKTIGDLSLILQQARTYALANNTYVFVGLTEADVTKPASGVQTQPGVGRLWVSVIASKDGTPNYDSNNITAGWQNTVANPNYINNLVSIQKPLFFENTHLVDLSGIQTGNMQRPAVATTYEILGSVGNGVFSFQAPLPPATALCTFNNVIGFDSQGSATILSGANLGTVTPWIEIGLQPTHGNVAPAAPSATSPGNIAALQISSSGAPRIYRP